MMKISLVVILVSLVVVGVQAQSGAQDGENGAPEPYSYGYETDTHSAAEQKDPSGTVTGFYTINDNDGRQRRVEYVADASGFRAKVQTNEVGTKSANSADVEVLASPPNQEQLVAYQQVPPLNQQQQQQQVVQVQRQQSLAVQQPPPVTTTTTQQRVLSQQFLQQQPQLTSGYNYEASRYGYYPAGAVGYGGNVVNSRTVAYGVPYGYAGYPYASNQAGYYSYNNHLPSQYYRSVQSQQSNGLSGVQQGLGGVRYVTTTTTTSNAAQPGASYQALGRSGYQTNQLVPGTVSSYTSSSSSSGNAAPQQVASYQAFGRSGYQTNQVVPGSAYTTTTSSQQQSRSQNLSGSSNYIVLKKRDSSVSK